MKALWRKIFLVDDIFRGSSAIPIMTLDLLKTPSVEGAHTIKAAALISRTQGIQVRSSDINDIFGQQANLFTKTILVTRRCYLEIMTWIQNLAHPC